MWPFKEKKEKPSSGTALEARANSKRSFDLIIERYKENILEEIKCRCNEGYYNTLHGIHSTRFEEIADILSNWLLDAGYEVKINQDGTIFINWK